MTWPMSKFLKPILVLVVPFTVFTTSPGHTQILGPWDRTGNSNTQRVVGHEPRSLGNDVPPIVLSLVKEVKKRHYFLSNLQGVNYRGGNFDQANFTGSNLQDTLFQGASFRKTNLYLANLQDSNLSRARMQKANLTAANLQDAILEEADLEQANLLLANFSHANLFRANLQDTFVAGANFHEANLRGANLTEAQGLTQEQINSACLDESTILPPHLVRPEPCQDYSWK